MHAIINRHDWIKIAVRRVGEGIRKQFDNLLFVAWISLFFSFSLTAKGPKQFIRPDVCMYALGEKSSAVVD